MSRKQSLYDRLGGIFSIAAVVDYFSDSLITNPIVGQDSDNLYLREWHTHKLDRLPGLKWMRTLWLCAVAGGPFEYSPTRPGKCPFSLENAHKEFDISPLEFNAVADELYRSLQHFHVPEREIQEVMNAFIGHEPDVTFGYSISRGITPEPIVCPHH